MVKTTTKLEKYPDAEEKAHELRNKGWGYTKIANALNNEFDFNISHMGVKGYFEKFGVLSAQAIRENKELKTKIEKEVINITEEIGKINGKLWQIIDDFETHPGIKVSALEKAMKLLETQNKLLSTVTISSSKQEVIQKSDFTSMAIDINKYLKKLEDQGYITIHKNIPDLS